MQCHACGFENLPGASTCARCASTLTLTQVAIEPPRASSLRLATRAARARNHASALVPSLGWLWRRLRRLELEPVRWRAVAWSLVPGLGHLKTRRRRLGLILLWSWLALLLLALITLGTSLSWILLSLAIAVHAAAVISIFAANLAYEGLFIRLAFGALLFILIQLLLYRPVLWTGTRVLQMAPLNHITAGPVIADGDVLICHGPWTRPEDFRRGDLVVYRFRPIYLGGYYIGEGRGVDRILAVPGDDVQIADGRLVVNGHAPPAERGPLRDMVIPFDAQWRLEADEYLIVPSRLSWADPRRNVPTAIMRLACIVDSAQIDGRVLWRLRPLSRFGAVE